MSGLHLPLPPKEVKVCRSLDVLAPKFRAAVEQLLVRLPDAIVAETLRTPERQAYLWGFGRDYDDGRGIVTQAHSHLYSWHGYGLAVDVWHKRFAYAAPATWFRLMGETAKGCGLDWGGDWTIDDEPHVQFGTLKASPSDHARELYAAGGVEAVWKAVGAL